MPSSYRGSCLCGVVCFEIDAFLESAAHCHCSMCRKFHGAAYATFASVEHSKFHLLGGEDALSHYVASNGTTRSFCRHCGSSLMFASPRAPADVREVALAALDGPVPVVPDAHIFVDSCVNWVAFGDALPRFRQGRGSEKAQQ